MTALEMNADIYRYMGEIARDEGTLKKAWRYLQRLADKMNEREEDPTRMSKEEYFAMIDESLAQAERGEVYSFKDRREMMNWLNSL